MKANKFLCLIDRKEDTDERRRIRIKNLILGPSSTHPSTSIQEKVTRLRSCWRV